MAAKFTEGWDKYGPPGISDDTLVALLVQGEWTGMSVNYRYWNGSISIVNGLSATGYALQIENDNVTPISIYKTLPGFYPRLMGGYRFRAELYNTCGITLFDSGVAQCSVTINTTGTISVRSGGIDAASIKTSTSSISSNSVHYLEFDITIGSSGSYQVWLDGLSIISGIGNTQGGTDANRINGFAFALNTNAVLAVDDLYLFDSTGTTSNAVLLTNPRIETQFPNGDAQAQFTNSASLLGHAYSATSNTNAPGADTIYLRQYTPEVNVTLNSVSCVPQATASAKFKAVVYSNTNTLLATGAEIFGTLVGVTITSVLTTPRALVAGTPYWIGFMTDSSVLLSEQDVSIAGAKIANVYADGAPPTLAAVSIGLPSWQLWGNCTGATTNWSSLNSNPAPGNLSYIASPTVGVADLYTFPALSSTPTSIYCVAIKGNTTRTDTGLRTVDMCVQSGLVNSNGSVSNVTPPTSFSWVDSYFDTDPNTGVAWTITGLNSATAGPKIES